MLRTIPSAAPLSASTGLTAQDKVDRLGARTVFRAPEPDALPEAVAVVEPGAQQAAVVVAAEPDAQLEAAAVRGAQPEAAVAAVAGAQQEAAGAEASGAQQAVGAAVSDAQQAAVLVPMAVAMKLRVRPLVASVEPAEMVVRLWFPARLASVLGQEESAKEQAR